jgi:SOS-response transcriptional repressor LexA
MSKLAAIIKCLMKEKDISVTELARQTRISQPVLHRLTTGVTYNPQIETLIPIASFFNITLDQLIGRTSLPHPLNIHATTNRWANVPLLGLDQALDWLDNRLSMIPTEFISTDSLVSPNSYAIQLTGSTMEPRFAAGTLFIIHPEYKPEDQDFVVVHTPGQKQAAFKQFLRDGEKNYLKLLNSDFPVIKMTKNHRILGTMVQARIDYGKKNAPY